MSAIDLGTEDVATEPRRAGYYADCRRHTVASKFISTLRQAFCRHLSPVLVLGI
jgi:hypothetical protein